MTAIREIDLARAVPPRLDGLGAATACMVVLRWRQRVVGRFFASVERGAVQPAVLAELISQNLTPDVLDVWLDDELGYDERAGVAPSGLTAAVAVCTRDRPDDLQATLAAVAVLQPAPAHVMVVDNAPQSGATREVVGRFPLVRYLVEPRRGLDHARNRALRESDADIVAFTDDDAAPEPHWLAALAANFQDPRVVCATGLTLPASLDTEAQELFERNCSFVRGFRRRVFDGQRDNPLHVGQAGAGANMAVRRQRVIELGGFDPRLDAGTATRSGGDHEIFTRILAAGHRIVYEPAAVSRHRHRRTMPELLSTVRGYGTGVYAMWTGLLLERREIGVLRLAWRWFAQTQLTAICRRSAGRRLATTELAGCLSGPAAWLASDRAHRAND